MLMGVTMWLQMKMNPEPTDEIQKSMFSWMPVIFTFTMGNFASGLVIYWTWNNLLSKCRRIPGSISLGTPRCRSLRRCVMGRREAPRE